LGTFCGGSYVSGLTFYGGLIGGFLGVWWYSRRQKLSFVHVCDATAPGLMLAYALGRIGCLMAGDGDWGIVNSAYRISPHQHYAVVHDDSLQHDLQLYYPYFDANTPEEVEHARMERPDALAFLPHWFFAFNFPHNVNNQGIPIPGCRGNYCSMLPLPVFPTMLYETVVCLLLFGFLWFMRPRISVPGKMFSLYLMINGAERLLIEQIRVNTTVNLFGMTVTQAEILAVMLIIIGLTGLLVLQRFSERILKL
jgi:phosphatidylglycerol---prolipoprotein diacylglyceryl transferase